MQEFRISETGLKELQKQVLLKTLPIIVIAAAAGITISQVNSKGAFNSNFVWFLVLFVTGMITFSFFKGSKRIESIYGNYRLKVGEDFITREQGNTPVITLLHSDIQEIIKNKNGSITLKTLNTANNIGIPAQIINYSELENQLNKIKPITEKTTQSLLERFGFFLVFIMIGLMAVVYIADNKVAVGLSGFSVAGFMIWSFFQTIKNKSIDNKTKRTSYWLILVVFSVIGITVLKLLK
jgi:hypothetical protein